MVFCVLGGEGANAPSNALPPRPPPKRGTPRNPRRRRQLTRAALGREAAAKELQARLAARIAEVERAWSSRIEQGFEGLLETVGGVPCPCVQESLSLLHPRLLRENW